MADSSRILLLGQLGIGYDPAALVIGNKDFEKRVEDTVDVSKDLVETPDTMDIHHGTHNNVIRC